MIRSDTLNNILKANQKYTDSKIAEMQKQIDELKEQLRQYEEEDYDTTLYEELRKERNTIAKENGLKPFQVMYNKTLKELCRKKPKTEEEIKQISGIKDIKYQQYGERFLQLINK